VSGERRRGRGAVVPWWREIELRYINTREKCVEIEVGI